MNEIFEPKELLFRSVADRFWHPNGRLDSYAFINSKKFESGLSVDRDGGRPPEEAARFLNSRKPGTIISFSVATCAEVCVLVRYCPSPNDVWHSEIHSSETEVRLTLTQANHLAKRGNYTIQLKPD